MGMVSLVIGSVGWVVSSDASGRIVDFCGCCAELSVNRRGRRKRGKKKRHSGIVPLAALPLINKHAKKNVTFV